MKDRETGRSRGFGFVVGFSADYLIRVLANLNWLVSLTRPTALPTRPTTPSLTWFVASAFAVIYES
jgi:RNA recognition motif-containing protein